MATDLTTQAEAARSLKVQPYVVSVVIRCYGIPTHPHPLNGNARCLDRAGMKRLEKGVAAYKGNSKNVEAACA